MKRHFTELTMTTYGREGLLQNSLIFYSTPPPPKLETLNKDIDILATRLNLREYHAPDTTDDIEQQPMYRPSILEKLNQRECREYHYMPSREPYLNSYVDRLSQDIVIEISNTHRFQRDNLNKREKAALKRLSNNRGIIIKPADKGGATVIVNTKDYITEAMWQLSNEEYYKKIRKDLTLDHEQLINQYIAELISNKDLERGTGQLLRPTNSTTPIFYILPKIHKPNNPLIAIKSNYQLMWMYIYKTPGRKTAITHKRHHCFYQNIEKTRRSTRNQYFK